MKSAQRIVIFTGTLRGGGAERVAVLLAKGLEARGHFVTLLTLSRSEDDFYEIAPSIHRIGLDLMGTHKGLMKIWSTLTRLRALRRVLLDLRADTSIAFMTQESILMIIASMGLCTRVIASERNNPERDPQPRLWRGLRHLTYRFADHHVVQTAPIANWLKKNAGVSNPIVIPNPIVLPLSLNPPIKKPSDHIPDGAHFILAVGSMPHPKGLDLLLRAYRQAAKHIENWHLVIAGMGDLNLYDEQEFEQELEQNRAGGLGDRIHCIGRCGNLGEWYSASDMFVLSSRYEGMPNVLLEAMAHGVASIAFDCPTGPAEIIQSGQNGLLVPPEDVAELAQAMATLAANEKMRRMMGIAAQQVLEDNCLEEIVDMWVKLLCPITAPKSLISFHNRS